jgi:hypothetical protein
MLKMPESGIVEVHHSFVRKQGLSDPTVMQQWRARSANNLSSSGSSGDLSDAGSEGSEVAVTVCIQPQAGARKAGCVTAL